MRKTYLDNIKWITVVLVVIYHVIYMYNGASSVAVIGPFRDVQYQDIYQYVVYPWFMLLLFVVSGMTSRYALENHTDREFIKARTTKYLVPSTLGLFVIWWIQGYINMAVGGGLGDVLASVPGPVAYLIMVLSGTGVLWYIQMLWVFSVILVWVRKIEKDRLYKMGEKTPTWLLILFTVVIYGAARILNTPIIVVYRFGIYGAGFLIGYFCLSHDAVMKRLTAFRIPLVIAAIALCVAFTVMYWGQSYAEHVVLDTLMCNVYAWIGCLAILAGMYTWGNFDNKISRFFNKRAWGLYVIHYLPLSATAHYLNVYAGNVAPVWCYLCVGLAAFAGALILNEILSRIPVIRLLALGISTKGKK